MNVDKDEIEVWCRHPVTRELFAELQESILKNYRVSETPFDIGFARGWDQCVQRMGRLLKP